MKFLRETMKNSWEMQAHIIKCHFMRVGIEIAGLNLLR
jgi:hypothetical protein